MNADTPVSGERTVAHVMAPRSFAVRIQRAMAVALLVVIGAAVLTWYYLHLGDDAKARAAKGTASLRSAVASEMKLPALDGPRATAPPSAGLRSVDEATRDVGNDPDAQGQPAPRAGTGMPAAAASPTISATNPQLHQSAPVLVRPPATAARSSDALLLAMRESSATAELAQGGARGANGTTLGDALQPTITKPAEAGFVPSRRWLLPKGSFLDCTLETAIDSTFAGLTTCILATDVFGADGRVVLMERGTKLVGETRSEVRTGQARVAVLWNEARTPAGVVLSLASPGTDALGRAGVPGTVDRHTGERFGAAVLLSVLDAAVGTFAARREGSGAVVYNAQESRDVATEALRNTIAIPPTIRVAAGARVMISVVRDIDFRAVYRLVAHEER